MKLHIFTLNWNGLDKLNNLRPGLYENLRTSNCTDAIWYIKDNGSKDGTVDEVKKWSDDFQIELHDIGHNRDNFAKGMNFLFEKSNANDDDLILLLNNDIVFGDDKSLQNMIRLMKKTDAGVVGARLLYPNSDVLCHAGTIFGPRYNNLPYHYRHKEKSDVNAEKNRYFQAVTAAVSLVKVSSFKRVGGFDQMFNWAFDDVSLNFAIGQNEKIAYCGETHIFHEESATLRKNNLNKLFMQHNVRYFREKWGGKYKIDHELYLKDPNYNVIN